MTIKKIPSWLEQLPSSKISPPVETQKQELPFKEMGWKEFWKTDLPKPKINRM